MTNIKDVLQKLSEYFDFSLTFDEIVEKDEQNELENLQIVANALNQSDLSNLLRELCTEYRMIRNSDVVAVHVETWNEFSKFVKPEPFSVFFYALIANAKSTNIHIQKCKTTALLAARCYCLCQTSPGSKAFGFFNEIIVEKCFSMLKMLELCVNLTAFRGNERTEIQIHCMTFLEDIEILLGIVSLDDYVELKQTLIENVATVLRLHFGNLLRELRPFLPLMVKIVCCNREMTQKTKDDIITLQKFLSLHNSVEGTPGIEENCYKVLSNLLLPLQGAVESNLTFILNGTIHLNRFYRTPSALSQQKIDSIINWFIALLDKYPNQTCLVLSAYIKHVLTVPTFSADANERLRNFDICVQYDSAMYTKCNQSIVDYLKELANSSDVADREACVEMVGKMLLVDSPVCSWSMSSGTIPREIDLLTILLTKLLDASNSIKVKTVGLFIRVTLSGNEMCKKIFKTFLPADIIEIDINEQTQNVRGIEELNDLPNKLFEISQWNMRNASALVRRSALILFEFVTTISVDIEEFISSAMFEKMVDDSSPMVRRQLVTTLDKIIGMKPKDISICKAYVKTMLFLANDGDPKIVDDVMDSLRKYIFDNIDKYEASASDKQLFPWKLLRLIIALSEDSLDLRKCIEKSINRKLMTAKTLSYVETYLDSPFSLDAWILLSMVASNIKSKTPEIVYIKLQDNLRDFANEAPTKAFYQLDVTQKWFDDLPRPSQSDLFSKFTVLMEAGKISPLHTKRVFEMCYKYAERTGELESWTNQLKTKCEMYILQNGYSEMLSNNYDHQLINYLVIYSETIDEPNKINQNVPNLLLNFLNNELPKKISIDQNLTQKANVSQIVLTRLAFRHDDILTKSVPTLAKILNRRDLADSVYATAIKCLEDLCKKYTQLVESVVSAVLLKTQSNSARVRKCAVESLAILILEDYLKFRGSLLLYVLAATADEEINIARLAHELIIKFANEKNPILIRSCLRECPFAFNDCKLVDNSEMFGSDLCVRSPLKSKSDARRYIYRFLVHNLEIINCYMYFENFSAIRDRITQKNFKKTPEILQSVQDFLYVCSHICKEKEIPKSKSAVTGGEQSDEEGETPIASKTNPETTTSTQSNNKRNKQQTTLPQAMVVVEKAISIFPQLNATLIELDDNFEKIFDQMCYAIGDHFGDAIKYVPNTFWGKYRKSKPAKRVRRKNDNTDDDSDDPVDASTSRISNMIHQNKREEQGSTKKMPNKIRRKNDDDYDSNDDYDDYDANSSKIFSTPNQKTSSDQRSTRKPIRNIVIDDDDDDDRTPVKGQKRSSKKSKLYSK